MNQALISDLEHGTVNHAYFFECDDEVALNRETEGFVKQIFNDGLENNPDYKVITVEDKSIKVDKIRELQKDVIVKPIKHEKKVYVIFSANKMNLAAQNCLLKTLEEPPENVMIILTGPSIYSVIGTIRSRVKQIKIESAREDIFPEEIRDMLDNFHRKNVTEIMKYSEFFDKNKDNVVEVLHKMASYCSKKISGLKNELSANAHYDIMRFAKYIEEINSAEQTLAENANFGMTIDNMLLNMRGL